MIYNDGSTMTLYYYVLNAQGDVNYYDCETRLYYLQSRYYNVAKSSKQAIYSIQNASGMYIDSIWATTEYNIVKGCEITYGVVSQNGYIQFLP